MTLSIEYTSQFKKDLKKAKKSNKDLVLLKKTMKMIQEQAPLPAKLRDHRLIGPWRHHRELHLEGDWLLIYQIFHTENKVVFVRLGSHSELFR